MAKAMLAEARPPAERKARKTLLWGAGLLVLGLALVGVGQGTMGSVPVLAGLVTTIVAIHIYGRLGPDDAEHAGHADDADHADDPSATVEGPPKEEEEALRARRRKARVEKRRRMDKSPAP